MLRLLFLTAVFAALAVTGAAGAPAVCHKRTVIVAELENRYSETQSGFGVTKSEQEIIELFTDANGNWTILMTLRDGTTCAMAVGKSWQTIERGKKQRHRGSF